MINKRLFVLLAVMFVNHLLYAQKTGTKTYDFSPIHNKIKTWVNEGYYNGASIFIAKDNQVVYEAYFGNYDTGTVAYIASAGKWLAAAAIAAVVDEGRLSWDDSVKKWLPAFKDVKGNATLRMLFSHTAGYPDYQPEGKRRDDYQTLSEAVENIIDLPADTLPGTKFRYGGLAMQVAGRMAELATGKSWEAIFQEKIARPLGMRSTHFTPVDTTPGHNPMIGGGARSSLHDYARFLQMVLNEGVFNGKRILSARAINEMQADQIRNASVQPGEFVELTRASARKDIYGLGEWREEVNARGEATLISSPSWAGAYPWIDKKNKVYGFFLTRVTNMKEGFSSFYASPVLPILTRDVLKDAAHAYVKRGFINVESGKLFYEELGAGEPLIFIHGHSFDHYEWEPQFYAFAKKYRVIRYDVRGYGRSSMPAEYSSCSHAEDLLQLMNTLKIKKAHIVGLSMGGFIATDFLTLHQDRLLSATMASGDVWYGSPGPASPWTESDIAKRKEEIQAYKRKGVFNNKIAWFNALTTRNGRPVTQLCEPVWNMIYKWEAWQPLHVEPRFLLGTSVIDKLQKTNISVPVLVLTGSFDADKKNKLMQLAPSAKRVIVENAGQVIWRILRILIKS
jgi:CubicO group peptidase (beta-lactamase class C family)/pimeloyl-ACP methyl ester carboxylesterase